MPNNEIVALNANVSTVTVNNCFTGAYGQITPSGTLHTLCVPRGLDEAEGLQAALQHAGHP